MNRKYLPKIALGLGLLVGAYEAENALEFLAIKTAASRATQRLELCVYSAKASAAAEDQPEEMAQRIYEDCLDERVKTGAKTDALIKKWDYNQKWTILGNLFSIF